MTDPVVALDLDNAVSLRLTQFRQQEQESLANRIAIAVGKTLFGDGSGGDVGFDTSGAEVW